LFEAKEMSELNAPEQVPDELIAAAQDADSAGGPPPESWETNSAPSLPSIDSHGSDVSYTPHVGSYEADILA
jgi:hypothetical protein